LNYVEKNPVGQSTATKEKNNAIFWKFAGWMSSLLFFNTSLFEKYILKNYVFKTTFPKFCFKNLHVRSLAAKDDDVLLMDNGVLSLIHNGPVPGTPICS